jgi:hypothetical protein
LNAATISAISAAFVAIVGAITALVVAFKGNGMTQTKLDTINVNTNHRLDTAIEQIADLKRERDINRPPVDGPGRGTP